MRYLIEQKKLDKDHPLWPGETLFYINDRKRKTLLWGCYTTIERASDVVVDLNSKDSL